MGRGTKGVKGDRGRREQGERREEDCEQGRTDTWYMVNLAIIIVMESTEIPGTNHQICNCRVDHN